MLGSFTTAAIQGPPLSTLTSATPTCYVYCIIMCIRVHWKTGQMYMDAIMKKCNSFNRCMRCTVELRSCSYFVCPWAPFIIIILPHGHPLPHHKWHFCLWKLWLLGNTETHTLYTQYVCLYTQQFCFLINFHRYSSHLEFLYLRI